MVFQTACAFIVRNAHTDERRIDDNDAMPSHEVTLKIAKAIEIQRSDLEIVVTSDAAKLGTLKISQGSIDWAPANNSVNSFEFKWERFAELMEQQGTPKRM
jgi:hypothetical protein